MCRTPLDVQFARAVRTCKVDIIFFALVLGSHLFGVRRLSSIEMLIFLWGGFQSVSACAVLGSTVEHVQVSLFTYFPSCRWTLCPEVHSSSSWS